MKAAQDAIAYQENSNSGEEVKLQENFPVKKTPWRMRRHSTVTMPMDIHKQAIGKRNWQVEFERQAEEQKQQEATLRLCLHKLPFILDFTDKKLWIAFKYNQWTDNFCYLNDAKCHLNFFKVSTQSIT